MSTELAKAPEPKAIIESGDRGMMLKSFEDLWRFSKAVHASGMVAKSFDTVEKIVIALQTGLEVGLPPMQALQSIAVIQGRATIWGDALPALVWASGLCEGIDETIEGTGDARTARCIAKRKGAGQITGTFSMGDAKRAGLLGKGTWSQYPDRMLKTRARAFCLRDGFADVLRGLQVREEVQDYHDTPPTEPKPVALTFKGTQTLPEPETVEAEPTELNAVNECSQQLERRIVLCNSGKEAAAIAMDIGTALADGRIDQGTADELSADLKQQMAD